MMLSKLIKSVIVLTSLLFIGVAQAGQQSRVLPYYGQEFFADLKAGVRDEALAQRLKTVLRKMHQVQANSFDKIVDQCATGERCYAHRAIGYNGARVWLMGGYYLKQEGTNGYAVWDVYCNEYRGQSDFRGKGPSPGTIPNNTVVNIEHTWPQSRFNRAFNKEDQKSDLHHLFPADSKLNAIRGNNWFGEVTQDTMTFDKCPNSGSRFGIGSAGSEDIFEPPMEHKGHVARALLYFAVRYDSKIDAEEEAILKKWNREHPVDEDEARRNNEIFKAQGNRNPFVDYPELADLISDF
ncbi:endonuclease I family protein [Bdellovibrio svalbardensis]|uniref:Endonuclease n=1 Tax=Bdellovibrio svalbardensis TaxID=2972972 RepID=A0ABT6DLP9_9BACT|nr:endonuclease [Bdellovibrio svalbardensis]MDG0817800.1 endonuclease [Bdellovibrio svalbardensis]